MCRANTSFRVEHGLPAERNSCMHSDMATKGWAAPSYVTRSGSKDRATNWAVSYHTKSVVQWYATVSSVIFEKFTGNTVMNSATMHT